MRSRTPKPLCALSGIFMVAADAVLLCAVALPVSFSFALLPSLLPFIVVIGALPAPLPITGTLLGLGTGLCVTLTLALPPFAVFLGVGFGFESTKVVSLNWENCDAPG